jgi:hypothetical protein
MIRVSIINYYFKTKTQKYKVLIYLTQKTSKKYKDLIYFSTKGLL